MIKLTYIKAIITIHILMSSMLLNGMTVFLVKQFREITLINYIMHLLPFALYHLVTTHIGD